MHYFGVLHFFSLLIQLEVLEQGFQWQKGWDGLDFYLGNRVLSPCPQTGDKKPSVLHKGMRGVAGQGQVPSEPKAPLL